MHFKIHFVTAKAEKSYADREDVHKPATNLAEKKHSDKVEISIYMMHLQVSFKQVFFETFAVLNNYL